MALSKILPASQEQYAGARNLIINGAMAVSQRSTSVTGITGGGYNTIDRIKVDLNDNGTWTHSQDTDVPSGNGFSNSWKLDVTTADTAVASGSYHLFRYHFEGQDLQQLKKGASNAESVTVSFWIRSTVTGTYIAELFDVDNSRQISQSYTISTADTWEKKTLTFAGDTSGALDDNNGSSLTLNLWFGAGSDFSSGTLNTSWASSTNANRAVGQVNAASSTSNNIYLTGVQLEVGKTATPFEHRSYGDELARCQRYYQTLTVLGTSYNAATAYTGGSNAILPTTNFSTMRTAPTVTFNSSGNIEYYSGSAWTDTTVSVQDTTDNYTVIVALGAGPSGVTRGSLISADQGTPMNALLDAEL